MQRRDPYSAALITQRFFLNIGIQHTSTPTGRKQVAQRDHECGLVSAASPRVSSRVSTSEFLLTAGGLFPVPPTPATLSPWQRIVTSRICVTSSMSAYTDGPCGATLMVEF